MSWVTNFLSTPRSCACPVNGLQSITSLEQKFNELRIQELDLLNIPESTIKAVLADIYKISEELHMHLQGGPLSDAPRLGRKEGDGIIISGENQRQKRIKDILDRIVRETSLYEEFVRKCKWPSYFSQNLNNDRKYQANTACLIQTLCPDCYLHS